MVYRVYVEKKKDLANEAKALLSEARSFLGIVSLEDLRVINRYDVENISEELFRCALKTVFSEPPLDAASSVLDAKGGFVFASEYLPGQFDQRADSAEQCIQMISHGVRPCVRTAKVYVLYGALSEKDKAAFKKHVINPVEAREASLEKPETLKTAAADPPPVETIKGFTAFDKQQLESFAAGLGLTMDLDDLALCRSYFSARRRDPTITEIRVLDTYWSDHCRHTTFLTAVDKVDFEDGGAPEKTYEKYLSVRRSLGIKKPVCLMDMATAAAKYLKKAGKLAKLDESEEINACTVKTEVDADGKNEPWLLLFKNETHNHPTEIEPFGGAATCIGGAIRDPLSGRAYVYGAMRISGAADPLKPLSETLEGKLPQRKIVGSAAAGYSSYGNQIGLATGIVDEIYHPGYAAKHMEIGAVIAAAPASSVRREKPLPGDLVILLGGSTGRDGIGGATGSSKAHDLHSVEKCGAEVQKGNAPEERKLQRLFRSEKAARLIKRCNDFGAGGVSVAIGELADGLEIDLDAVPKKYEGLDGTELAVSESQERMAVVVSPEDAEAFIRLADGENLSAVPVAVVTDEKRLVMKWRGQKIVDLERAFLNTNGAEKHISVTVEKASLFAERVSGGFAENCVGTATDLNVCSKRGLAERFDSTIGAGTVLMPFGGKNQLTPVQAMVQKIPLEKKHTDSCSFMSWGFNPYLTEQSPYHGAYLAVVESVCRLVASGAPFRDVYLTFQEYFGRPGTDGRRWGKPFAALLGAFAAQLELGVAAIGGKDSMSGSFENLDVPPTLVSFAVATGKCSDAVSPEFKRAGNKVVLLKPETDADGLPAGASLLRLFDRVYGLLRPGKAVSCFTPGFGGIGAAVMKMAFGNGFGFKYADSVSLQDIFRTNAGSFILELTDDTDDMEDAAELGTVTDDGKLSYKGESVETAALLDVFENKLESIYPSRTAESAARAENISYKAKSCVSAAIRTAKPVFLIPVFPGTNCEYDSAKAVEDAGGIAELFVVNNRSADSIVRSVGGFAERLENAQAVFIPGGFSGGDEPDGSGKFITAFFRNDAVRRALSGLLDERGGLMCGICNGFQALIKLGLVPYGKITEPEAGSPTLSFNTIAHHRSRIVRTRIASDKSPWLSLTEVGEVYSVPISHGEGRFLADEALVETLAANGQIAAQYVDPSGCATMDIRYNPNGSVGAIEAISSPDGRILGKMGHSERIGQGLYKNVPGRYDIKLFRSAVRYFAG